MTVRSLNFFTPRARLPFIKFKQVFVKTPILNYFNWEYYIQIETDVLGYTIGRVFNQLSLNNLSQWYLIVFIFQKMISTETRHKTYNVELLAIVEVFKT